LPDEAISSTVSEDCLAPVGFAPAGLAMTKSETKRWGGESKVWGL